MNKTKVYNQAIDIFSQAINNLVNELGVEGTIRFYNEAVGWNRKKVLHLIRLYVYPYLK